MVKFYIPNENEDDIEEAQNEEDLKPLRSIRSMRSSFGQQAKKAQSTLTWV
jgi:hypothetical protein